MNKPDDHQWKDLVVSPEDVLNHSKPGMNIFQGSGVAESRTLMICLIDSGLWGFGVGPKQHIDI